MQQITISNPTYTYLNKRQWKQKGKGETPLAAEMSAALIDLKKKKKKDRYFRFTVTRSANAGCQPHAKINKNVLAPPTVGLSTR